MIKDFAHVLLGNAVGKRIVSMDIETRLANLRHPPLPIKPVKRVEWRGGAGRAFIRTCQNKTLQGATNKRHEVNA